MTEWQPIETAPKDGTRILAYGRCGFDDISGIATVAWIYEKWVCDPNEATEYDYEECQVTHWMPLPEFPR
jgi:Protein of unknown function (DUF551)